MEFLLRTPWNRRMAIPSSERSGWIVLFLFAFMAASLVPREAGGADFSLQTLHGFEFNPKNPQAGLVQANDGNFYGATAFGGAAGENGTIFRITPNGVLTPLFSFNSTNGSRPVSSLIQGSDGALYGTTAFGGTNGDNGTVFKITTSGAFTPLFSFNGTNGSRPMSSLVQGSDSNFYGTTSAGGLMANNGTVFRISPSGTFTALLSFSGANGSFPAAGLVQGSDGNLYGTTQFGGTNNSDNGTVFKITPGGTLTSLFSFSGPNGNWPVAPLVSGSDGNFYGTTSGDRSFGGTNTFGTAFRITPAGALTTLASFESTNGACPLAGLTLGSDRNFYGTTFQGGQGDGGTIFRLVEPPRIAAITASPGSVTLCWTSFSNGIYRVEYKPALVAPSWTTLAPDVTATSDMTCVTDSVGAATLRFYRIRVLP
jgi:uncharacterized repeat protein (TIGR03803 family)